MTGRVVITIDGLVSTGKTSIARLLAAKLGFIHVNTGLIYRAVGFLAYQNKLDYSNVGAIVGLIKQHNIELRQSGVSARLFIDDVDMNDKMQDVEASVGASNVAQHGQVRDAIFAMQREAFAGKNIVAEGRDMGTVVFQDAQLKFFVTADAAIRAARRLKDMQLTPEELANPTIIKNKLKLELEERDKRDSERTVSPTIPAKDAVMIDNSAGSLEETVEKMFEIVQERGLGN